MYSVTIRSAGDARQTEVPQLQQQRLLQVAGGDADRIEALDQLERLLDVVGRPGPIDDSSSTVATR